MHILSMCKTHTKKIEISNLASILQLEKEFEI